MNKKALLNTLETVILSAAIACATPGEKGKKTIHPELDTTRRDEKQKIEQIMDPSQSLIKDGRIEKRKIEFLPRDAEDWNKAIAEEKKRKQEEQANKSGVEAYLKEQVQLRDEALLNEHLSKTNQPTEPPSSSTEMNAMVEKVIQCVKAYDACDKRCLHEDNGWQHFVLQPPQEIEGPKTRVRNFIYYENNPRRQLEKGDYSIYPFERILNIDTVDRYDNSPCYSRKSSFTDEHGNGDVNNVVETYSCSGAGRPIQREYANGKSLDSYVPEMNKYNSLENLEAATVHTENLQLADEMAGKYGEVLKEIVDLCDGLDSYEEQRKIEIPTIISRLKEKYGFTIKYDESIFGFNAFNADGSDILGVRALPTLQQLEAQLNLLPTSLVKKLGPKNINFVKGIIFKLHELQGEDGPVVGTYSAYDFRSNTLEVDLLQEDSSRDIVPAIFWAMDLNSRKQRGESSKLVFNDNNPFF